MCFRDCSAVYHWLTTRIKKSNLHPIRVVHESEILAIRGHNKKCSSLNPTHLQPEAYTLLIQLQPVQQCVHTQRKKKETYPKALPFGAFERWRITDPNRLAMWPSMAIRTWKILDHFQQIHTAMLLGMFVASSVHLVDKVRCDCKAMFLPPFNLTEAWAVNFSSYPCCF